VTAAPTFSFSLAVGTDGAYEDVTADVLFEEGDIPFSEGRAAEWDDVRPGSFSFTLANGDGKYTPDNLATTLATPLSEGVGAVLQLGDLLLSGEVRSLALIFPPLERAGEARVRVTVDDMLTAAARREFGDYEDLLAAGTPPLYWWPLDDIAGSSAAAYRGTANDTLLSFTSDIGTFGVNGIDGVSDRQMRLTGTAGTPRTAVTSYYGTGSGTISVWLTVESMGDAYVTAGVLLTVSPVIFGIEGSSQRAFLEVSGTRVYGPAIKPQVPYFFSVRPLAGNAAFNLGVRANLNGVEFGAINGGSAIAGPTRSSITLTSATTALFSQLGMVGLPFGVLAQSTPETRLSAIQAFTADTIEFDTFPTLSDVVYGAAPVEGQTALDALNDVIRAEQCYMWVETTGTLTEPEPKIKVGARVRERAIDYTFDVSEIVDPIAFSRSLRNTVSLFTANGPEASATYQDDSLIPLVGAASSSDSLLLRDYIDLYAYASDRVSRGINYGVPILSITVNATDPLIDRWDDLTAIRQGHRIQVTGLPSTQLGYGTWDGFVVGRSILNTQDSRTDEPRTYFTFNLAPWLPVAVYGTARYAAGETLSLSADINSSVTSFSVATTAAKLTTTPAHFPFDIRIGSEILTVTAASGATPQVLTVTRGVNAAAHTAGTNVELADVAVVGTDRYAY
jgi:hypothetical protein